MDPMGILANVALVMAFLSVLSGFLITVVTGSPRLVKYFLAVVTSLSALFAIVLLVFLRAFIYLLFQYITVILALCFLVIFGATLGYGFHLLLHKKPPGKNLSKENLDDYLPSQAFAQEEGISEERAIARIKSGYYDGGLLNGIWYVQKSELSSTENKQTSLMPGNEHG